MLLSLAINKTYVSLKITNLQKIIKLAVVVSVFKFFGRKSSWNYFSLPICTFPVKRQTKYVTSVHSCISVTSAKLHNLEITKMSITITIMLTVSLICEE